MPTSSTSTPTTPTPSSASSPLDGRSVDQLVLATLSWLDHERELLGAGGDHNDSQARVAYWNTTTITRSMAYLAQWLRAEKTEYKRPTIAMGLRRLRAASAAAAETTGTGLPQPAAGSALRWLELDNVGIARGKGFVYSIGVGYDAGVARDLLGVLWSTNAQQAETHLSAVQRTALPRTPDPIDRRGRGRLPLRPGDTHTGDVQIYVPRDLWMRVGDVLLEEQRGETKRSLLVAALENELLAREQRLGSSARATRHAPLERQRTLARRLAGA